MNGWRVFVDVECNVLPFSFAWEITGIPFLPRIGEAVDVPMFDDGSGDLVQVTNIHYWCRNKFVTMTVDFFPEEEQIATLQKIGWIEWRTENMRGEGGALK